MNYYFASDFERIFGDMFDTDCMQLTGSIWEVIEDSVLSRLNEQIDRNVVDRIKNKTGTGNDSFKYWTINSYSFTRACWSLGDGTVSTISHVDYSWFEVWQNGCRLLYYIWTAKVYVDYSDVYMDPTDTGIELPFSQAYSYFHTWNNVWLGNSGVFE